MPNFLWNSFSYSLGVSGWAVIPFLRFREFYHFIYIYYSGVRLRGKNGGRILSRLEEMLVKGTLVSCVSDTSKP